MSKWVQIIDISNALYFYGEKKTYRKFKLVFSRYKTILDR